MALAPPVSRSNFHYDGNLYVEVGTLNRHKRANVEEITTILRPDLKKAKKASIDPPKDQVGHWYEAQLIHYGLPPSKDKARAKMRLLEALNSSRLIVPPNIATMEAEMKREYAAAERKAKAQYKASRAPANESEPLAGGKKRKQSEPSGNVNNINVNISLGNDFRGLSGGVNATDRPSPAKKAKTGPSKPANKKTEAIGTSKSSKKTTERGIKEHLSQAQNVHEKPRQTARKSVSSTKTGAAEKKPARKEPIIKKQSGVKQESKVLGETKVKKEIGTGKESKAKKEAGVKKESIAKPSPQIKHEPGMDWSPTPRSPLVGLINGIYDLSCPTVEGEWSCTDLSLILSLDGTSVWGAYDLGMFSGIFLLPDRPWQASNEPLPFTWRGRENGEGEMRLGHGCKGEISFLGNGNIEGWISVYGRCAFEGVRRHEAGTAVRTPRSMREEWEGYNERTYEEERTGRWG